MVGSGVSGFLDPKELSPEAIKHWTTIFELARKGDVEKAREMDAKYFLDGPNRTPDKIDPSYRERARQLHRESFSLDRFKQQETLLTPPAIGRLREIQPPVLVVVGDNDTNDILKLADRFEKEIRHARRVTIKNAAHLPSLEHPAEFNTVLIEFLN